MSKELKFEFNDYIIAIDEPYENDCGYVVIGKKDTKGNINIWFKSLNEQTVDFYIELQKHIVDLEAKLAEQQECSLKESAKHNLEMQNAQICIKELEAKLAESEKKFIIANNLRKNSDEVLLNYKTEKYGLDKTIQELRKMKLSLAEKEWYYKGFENCERQMSSYIADLTLEVKELKQQLAEKEKEIETLQHYNDRLAQGIYHSYGEHFVSKIRQDKISFCIEQLEKFKTSIENADNNNDIYIRANDFEVIDEIFYNQIEELKKEK